MAEAVHPGGRLDSVVCNAGLGVFGGICDYPDDVASAVVTVRQQLRRVCTELWSMWGMAEQS